MVYPALLGMFLFQGGPWALPIRMILRVLLLKRFFLTRESGFRSHYHRFLCDNIRLIFCLLSVLVVLISARATNGRRKRGITLNFYISLVGLVLLFSTNNLITYFLLFELSLVPLYFLITFWGGQYERVLSNYYFVMFSVVTSFPLLLIVCEVMNEGRLEYTSIIAQIPSRYQVLRVWVILRVLIAFIAKLPVYRLHSWLPKAHVDAPVGRSIVLARILLKLRRYRVLRLVLRFSSSTSFLLVFRIWGYLVTAAICMRLVDYKVIVAYSSVSHISIAFSRLISYFIWRLSRSFYIIVRHRVVSPLIFYLGNLWYERVRTRRIRNMKRSKIWFRIRGLFLFSFLFNIRFPPFINFFAEVSLFYSVIRSFSVCRGLSFLRFCFSRVCWLNIFVMIFHSKKPERVSNYLSLSELVLGLILVAYFLVFSVGLSVLCKFRLKKL